MAQSGFYPYEQYSEAEYYFKMVPSHWTVSNLRHLNVRLETGVSVNASDRPAEDGEVGVLKTSCVSSGRFRPEENKVVLREDLWRVKCPVRPGEIIVSRMNTPDLVGASAFVEEAIPDVYLPDRLWQTTLTGNERLSPKFLSYQLKESGVRAQISILAEGASSSMQSISREDFSSIPLMLPPLDEQEKIAQFLDVETAKIDTLIEKQQQLIALLKEKRQAVISHAVTKGLNPDAPMRDSGVEWLGEVPAHWDVKPLYTLVEQSRRIMYGIVLPGPNVENGVPIVKGGDVKPGRLTLDQLCKTTFEIESGYARSRLNAGDLVYSIRGTIGDVEIVPKEIEGANLTQDAARIAPANGVNVIWLKFALESKDVFSQLEIGSLGAAVRGINIRDLKKAILPVPPEPEMNHIAETLERKVNEFEYLRHKVDLQLLFLKEKRAALISAAVTGKIDVRNWEPESEVALT